MNKTILEVKNLSTFTPRGKRLATQISFSVSSGDILIIQGANGSGKTTLAKCLLGLHKHYQGTITGQSQDFFYLPQLGNLQFFFPLSLKDVIYLNTEAKQNLLLPLNINLFDHEQILFSQWNYASGGERQKTMLTSAFLSQAKLLILDEPFNHLDANSKVKLHQLIDHYQKNGIAFILITHEKETDFANTQTIMLPSNDVLHD
jgi:ABC-type Mn2+/Zn2+ transport system ATPase subunit